jgi:murein L,D-transpeptidase YcbB/YkuD
MVLLAVTGALAVTGCVSTDQPPSPVLAAETKSSLVADTKAQAPTSAYLGMLRSHGIDAQIPAQGKFILVNIPAYELIALQDGVPVLRSRVIVGQPKASTPEMQTSMSALQFNPAWTPTPSMIRNEGLHYIPPGPQNPLGRVLFDLDNDEFIYLHDTNERGLFSRDKRALSHGCIRVEQARPLAAWVLGVSEQEIDAMIAKGTYSVPLSESIPVSLAYYTRFPDEAGQVVSYPDIYGTGQAKQSVAPEPARLAEMSVPSTTVLKP